MNRKSKMSRAKRKARKDVIWADNVFKMYPTKPPSPEKLAPSFKNRKSIFHFWNLNFRFSDFDLRISQKLCRFCEENFWQISMILLVIFFLLVMIDPLNKR